MNNYYKTLINEATKKNEAKIAKYELNIAKKKIHALFCAQNKKTILFIDILFVLSIILNFSALLTTNYLTQKNAPTIQLYTFEGIPLEVKKIHVFEVNPIQSKLNDFVTSTQTKEAWKAILKQISIWFFLVFGFMGLRRSLMTEEHLTSLFSLGITWFIIICWNAVNDLAILAGIIT